MGETTKKFLLSFALFVIGFIVGFQFLGHDFKSGFLGGWGFGGTIWGWYLTRKWFPPKTHEDHSDTGQFLAVAGFMIRVMITVAVGLIAMPIELVKGIITLVKIKKNRDAAIANNVAENE